MSWTEEKQRLWDQKKEALGAGFEQLKNSDLQTAQSSPDDTTRLHFYETQLTQLREELSTLIVDLKYAL